MPPVDKSLWVMCWLSTLEACSLWSGPQEGELGGKCAKASGADRAAGFVANGNGDAFWKCKGELICNTSRDPHVCEEKRGEGGPCKSTWDCKDGHQCMDDACTKLQSRTAGDPCYDKKGEKQWEVCDLDAPCSEATRKCERGRDVGESCKDHGCKFELSCERDTCQRPAPTSSPVTR